MEGHHFFFLILFSTSSSDWVLLPSVSKQDLKNTKSPLIPKENEVCVKKFSISNYAQICSEIHNLTAIGYGSKKKESNEFYNELEISSQDVVDILKLNQEIPNSINEKVDLVKKLGEALEIEAANRIRNLFPSENREARTKHIFYPSMESTLMTISILLFGVYLTKLVGKLLNSQQNRYTMNPGIIGNIRRPIQVGKIRRKRSVSTELKMIHKMNLINNYSIQFY